MPSTFLASEVSYASRLPTLKVQVQVIPDDDDEISDIKPLHELARQGGDRLTLLTPSEAAILAKGQQGAPSASMAQPGNDLTPRFSKASTSPSDQDDQDDQDDLRTLHTHRHLPHTLIPLAPLADERDQGHRAFPETSKIASQYGSTSPRRPKNNAGIKKEAPA
ncbi:hypothetical protein SODALDRAFT_354298 [Sodiomyces alkalinus F11]|uniref:Uncharacterized protein n=1 Tax=Sodiomyces alkalinus (strain CBS 110278 / VKM F-3762 / F11) TaxID=1314773 RepID=A0A3N2Q5Y9_SODAK|nr:hypothetical protein SODALDRAFT_354298 [Sodiomyces alkalinus F11]ROT42172.1 hypothetical protein SODALDRAFT_354298 [Sodiomyces alkalinus F11]